MSRAKSLCSPWRGWALVVALCAGACGGPPEALEEAPPPLPEVPSEGGSVSAQGYERQGMRLKALSRAGYERHGDDADIAGVPVIQGFLLSSVVGAGSVHDRAALNQGALQVWRSAHTGTTPSLTACLSPTAGETRRCGWTPGGVGRCTPGVGVTVSTGACNVAGAEDTLLRVCPGSMPCEYGPGMLGSNDDACNSLSARVTFTCPASGGFNVLVAPYRSTTPLTAKPSAVGAGLYPYYNVVQTGAALNGSPVKAVTLDGDVIPMRIKAVYDELPEPYVHPGRYGLGTTHRYLVEEQQADGQWVPLCGPDVDAAGLNVAIPVAGWWERNGNHRTDDADLFTFSCGRGVITKCYRWGYRPWDEHSTQASGRSAQQLHQACTRMARADYCGNGISWTQNDTGINLWDVAHIQEPAATLAGHSFEAGWNTWGAVCLALKRWSHAPDHVFYEGCPNLFTISDDEEGNVQRTPRYCSSQADAQAFDSSAVLFNESAPNLFPGPSVPTAY